MAVDCVLDQLEDEGRERGMDGGREGGREGGKEGRSCDREMKGGKIKEDMRELRRKEGEGGREEEV